VMYCVVDEIVRWRREGSVGRKPAACLKLERMLRDGEHPDRQQVSALLGRPLHLHMGGSCTPQRYSTAELMRARYWGYYWEQYAFPLVIEFDHSGRVVRLSYGWG
jgi:hypothetical protein